MLIALHAHWMEGSTYLPLAGALYPEWRLVALDQRGHGYSGHAQTYSRPHTQLVELAGGHLVHRDNPLRFAEVVKDFLQSF